jgi:hypothetical protein
MSTMDTIRPIRAKATTAVGLRTRKRNSLGRTARYGLFGVTLLLLLKATIGVSQTSAQRPRHRGGGHHNLGRPHGHANAWKFRGV